MALTNEERFWRKVDKSGECWMWKGYTTEQNRRQWERTKAKQALPC